MIQGLKKKEQKMAANKIKKYEEKANKEIDKLAEVQDEYAKSPFDRSRGPIITQRELVEDIEPLSKTMRKREKRVKNAEINLQRAKRRGK
jgi:hypothetical protein